MVPFAFIICFGTSAFNMFGYFGLFLQVFQSSKRSSYSYHPNTSQTASSLIHIFFLGGGSVAVLGSLRRELHLNQLQKAIAQSWGVLDVRMCHQPCTLLAHGCV